MITRLSLKSHPTPHRRLTFFMLAFAIASLIHFVHNAEFISDYPGLPKTWTRNGVYGAWLVMTTFGFCAWLLTRTRFVKLSLALVAGYALCGVDSLGHYFVAPLSAHETMMNVTILLEVSCALALLIYVGFLLFMWKSHSNRSHFLIL
jgi:hypothetical protein